MTNYKIPEKFMGEDGKTNYERVMRGEEKPKEQTPIANPNFQSNQDFWTIENVAYRNNLYKVNLLKTLLDNGNAKTQEQWIEYSKQAKQNNNFYVGDFPLYHSLFTSLYKLKDKSGIEEIRSFLEKQFNDKGLMTLTRIKYNSSGKDEIIHNYKMPDEYSIEDNFVGPDEYVKNSKNKINYKSLLGSDNLQEINSIYNWITKKDTYLWRANPKPRSLDERVARFNANSDGANLNCDWNPSSTNSSLGVRACKAGLAGGIK